jgi:hypothetical protein
MTATTLPNWIFPCSQGLLLLEQVMSTFQSQQFTGARRRPTQFNGILVRNCFTFQWSEVTCHLLVEHAHHIMPDQDGNAHRT